MQVGSFGENFIGKLVVITIITECLLKAGQDSKHQHRMILIILITLKGHIIVIPLYSWKYCDPEMVSNLS